MDALQYGQRWVDEERGVVVGGSWVNRAEEPAGRRRAASRGTRAGTRGLQKQRGLTLLLPPPLPSAPPGGRTCCRRSQAPVC